MSGRIATSTVTASRSRLADFYALTKPGITLTVTLTAAVGYWMGVVDNFALWTFLHVIIGTALSSAGACALNMAIEHRVDARMGRTAKRPIPDGRIDVMEGTAFGFALAVAGVAWLGVGVGLLAGLIAAFITIGYLFAYTPLKPMSSVSTLVGALVGAAPPLIGWLAATGALGLGGWLLMAIIVFWQWPHILSMAWMNREDYQAVDYKLAPVADGTERSVAAQMLFSLVTLGVISVLPFWQGMVGWIYLVPAAAVGGWFALLGVRFAFERTRPRARAVFFASLVYLPVVLVALVFGKL